MVQFFYQQHSCPQLAPAAKGGQVKYATGPFTYDPAVAGETTFLGSLGGPAEGGFTIYAPGGGTSFPSAGTAQADIRIFGIEKVADADGNPLVPAVEVPLSSSLGSQITGAFTLTPASNEFTPGSFVAVDVSVNNPNVAEADYGVYIVTIKAQAPGSGVGAGSGSRYKLSLRAAGDTDTTPPDVTINSPSDASSPILGVIAVNITANDPVPGTGVVSIAATVKSAGTGLAETPIALTTTVPQPAGSDATGTGSFIPTGGTGSSGTTLGAAFDVGAFSGIGSYILTAKAVDGAGNEGAATSAFQVKYDVQFTQQHVVILGGPNVLNGTGQFKFTVKRSASTSDGAFMFDKTVTVYLVRTTGDTVVSTHQYGTASVNDFVQIDGTVPEYLTHFRKIDFAPGVAQTQYKAEIWFKDVDGALVKQAESDPVTF